MYENKGIDQMNVVSELVARILQTEAKSLDPVVMTETSTSKFFDISGWMTKLKVTVLTIIGIIVTAGTIAVTVKILPLKKLNSLRSKTQEIPINEIQNVGLFAKLKSLGKKKQEIPINKIESVELLPRAMQPEPPTQGPRNSPEIAPQMQQAGTVVQHEHKRTVYVRGIGLLWRGCNCMAIGMPPELLSKEN